MDKKFSEWEKMVKEVTGGGVYRVGEHADGRCNSSCLKCGSDKYKSEKPDPNDGGYFLFCDC